MPIGHPKGRFGPVRRRPLNEFVFHDRYGNRNTSKKPAVDMPAPY
ncbi:MAG: hypothetical protein U9N79_09865 [Actinomycetota bacterium]|nr:hypothetical protein [Actinomycetota bacterium]